MLCREMSKSVVCHVCRRNAGSEFVYIIVGALLLSRVRMYAGTNPVTLRNNLGSLLVLIKTQA